MQIRNIVHALLVGTSALGLSVPVVAQPRPAPPMGMRPTPPTRERPAAPPSEREDHEQGAARQHETEAQIRARLQKQQDEKAAQRAAARKDTGSWDRSREQRAARDRNETASNWGDIAEQADAKAELATHAERMAQLNRILDVAKDQGDATLAARTNAVLQREITRDTRVMQGIRARVGGH